MAFSFGGYMGNQLDDIDMFYLAQRYMENIPQGSFTNFVFVDLEQRKLSITVDNLSAYPVPDFGKFVPTSGNAEAKEPREETEYDILPADISQNRYAGQTVCLNIGEGLIGFCYTPIIDQVAVILNLLNELKEVKQQMPFLSDHRTLSDIAKWQNQRKKLLMAISALMQSHLYIYLYPPFIADQEDAFQRYMTYLQSLQKEFSELLRFCFDMDFYPDDLKDCHAAARFRLYRATHSASSAQYILKQRFSFRKDVMVTKDDVYYYDHTIADVKKKAEFGERKIKNLFEEVFNLAAGYTDIIKSITAGISLQYVCNTVEQMLVLEFEKMLELDIKIKKCRNCGQYFVLKGNYKTDFCDLVPAGETRTCQVIGAMNNYQRKMADSPALQIYNKYYKRYFARSKTGAISEEEFQEWKEQAVLKREQCLCGIEQGGISEDDFIAWLENAFPNRKQNK